MPMKGGPRASRRKYYFQAVLSILMYAISIWGHVITGKKTNKTKVTRMFRPLKIRTAFAYRTIGEEALDVISGIPPIHLLVAERMEIQGGADKKKMQEETLIKWQEEWENAESATRCKWTKRLIRNVSAWCGRRHGELSFQLTQLLSGHGCFGRYLYLIGKRTNESCVICNAEVDNAQHAFFDCPDFLDRRDRLERDLNDKFSPDTVVNLLLESKEKWRIITTYVHEVNAARQKRITEMTTNGDKGAGP